MSTDQIIKKRKCDYINAGSFKIQESDAYLISIVTEGVCICLWNSVEKKGGMCNFNPPPSGEGREQGEDLIFRFLKNIMTGCQSGQFVAAVIGGAQNKEGAERGEENIKLAHEYLELHGIPVVLNEERGTRPRKISLDTIDGSIKTFTL